MSLIFSVILFTSFLVLNNRKVYSIYVKVLYYCIDMYQYAQRKEGAMFCHVKTQYIIAYANADLK